MKLNSNDITEMLNSEVEADDSLHSNSKENTKSESKTQRDCCVNVMAERLILVFERGKDMTFKFRCLSNM